MRGRWCAALLICGLGCSFDDSGGSAGGSLGPSADDDPSAESTSATSDEPGPGGTSEADSMGGTTNTSTTDPTTSDPTTSDPTTSDPTTSDPTTSDPTTDGPPPNGDDTTTTDGDAESTGEPFEWYTACPCEDDIEWCSEFTQGGQLAATVCYAAVSCESAVDCPLPSNGTATPWCWQQHGRCALDCAGGATCPEGMECWYIGNISASRCVWPL